MRVENVSIARYRTLSLNFNPETLTYTKTGINTSRANIIKNKKLNNTLNDPWLINCFNELTASQETFIAINVILLDTTNFKMF